MSLKKKKKEFKFTFAVLIRLLIFAFLVYLAIRFLSVNGNNKKSFVLGNKIATSSAVLNLDPVYNLLPTRSKDQIDNLKSASTSAFIQEKIDYIKNEASQFPAKQIKEIQKQVVNRIYDNIIDSIEKK